MILPRRFDIITGTSRPTTSGRLRSSNCPVVAGQLLDLSRPDEQLPGHDQAVCARRGLDFQIQLIRISAIEHLSSTHVGRAEACKSRLEKAIEEQPDSAANFLSFRYQSGRYKTGLDDAERVSRRLVTGFPS